MAHPQAAANSTPPAWPHLTATSSTNPATTSAVRGEASLDLQVAEHSPGTRVVTVVGEIDALTAPELAAFLTEQVIAAQLVVVDLDGVRFLSSAGLRALFEANEFATREGRDLRLVCHSHTANWALEATGLREHFAFTDTVPRSTGPLP